MKAVKILSIVGIVLFVFAFICEAGFQDVDPSAAIGWGVIAELFGIGYAITSLVVANGILKNKTNE